ncbi:MAG: MFS transporter [Clostridiales bacterium]|jgi:MFS family permease|nr:MFS transporter [Clostridiales bacterium]
MVGSEVGALYEPLWTKSFWKIWVLNFVVSIWFFIHNVVFPFYVKHLGGTEMTVGLVAACFALTAILMRPVAGWILDHKSRGGLLKFGVPGMALVSVLFLIAPVLSLAVVLRLASGLIFSGVGTASNTNACDIIPQSRFGEGMAFLGLGNSLSNAVGPALGLLIMTRYGFNASFVVAAVLVLLAIFAAQSLVYKPIERRENPPGQRRLKLSGLFSAAALPASVLLLYAAAAFGGISVFIALYGEISGLGSGGIFFMLVALGTGSTRLFSGRLADKYGELPMVVMGNSGFFLGLLLLLFISTPCYYLAGLFFGLGFGLLFPAMQTMAVRTVPMEKRGAATSTFMCSYDIGAGLGGLLAGWLVTIWGYRPMFGVMIIFVILSCLTYWLWASKTPSAFKNFKGVGTTS